VSAEAETPATPAQLATRLAWFFGAREGSNALAQALVQEALRWDLEHSLLRLRSRMADFKSPQDEAQTFGALEEQPAKWAAAAFLHAESHREGSGLQAARLTLLWATPSARARALARVERLALSWSTPATPSLGAGDGGRL
jgi:hypothetical protein